MGWWYKRHPELLIKISNDLGANSNYNEIFQYRDNLLISCGEILVRSQKIFKYPILIVYPDSTPYILPTVILLKKILSEYEIKILCTKRLFEILEIIKDKIEFYDYRHQNSDGSLCLLEADNLHDESPSFYTTHSIINRIRDWFAGLKTGKFPPDSPEVELFYHFPKQCKEIEFLFPVAFYSRDVIGGEFYCSLIAVPQREDLQEKRIYLGALLNGTNKYGLYENVEFKSALQLMPKGIKTPLDLIAKQDILKGAIEAKKILKGYWWDIDCEPTPFSDFDKVAEFLGENDKEKGYERFFNTIKDEIKYLPDEIIIALRFSNRRGDLEWQSLIMKKVAPKHIPPIGFTCSDFRDVLKNYEVSAIYSEPFTDEKYHLRNSLRAKRDILQNKRINIIGCGALGGEIADCLGKAGAGILNLIDKEFFKAHNAIRHVASIEMTGVSKVQATGQAILTHNPFVRMPSFPPIDILNQNINEYFFPNSIGVSSIADDNIEGFLNEQAIINNKTVYYVRALRGGKVARIFRVVPGKDACLICLSIYHQEKDSGFINIPEDENFPTITNECNNPIRPASAADLKLIASIASRLVINELQENEEDNNHWIWTTEKIEGLPYDKATPFTLHSSHLPPHPKCDYCKDEDPIKILISSEADTFIKSEIKENPAIETGGLLVGYKENNGDVNVKLASGPGPKAVKSETGFEKDIEFCQTFINENYKKFGDRGVYVGEWHYHPSKDNDPSRTDLLSLNNIAIQKEYLTEKPIMIIYSNEEKPSCTVHPANKKYYFSDFKII